MISDELIKRLRELSQKATARPWVYLPPEESDEDDGAYDYPGGIEDNDGDPVCEFGTLRGSGCMFEHADNHHLIKETVNALPALLDEIERLRKETEWQDIRPVMEAFGGTSTVFEGWGPRCGIVLVHFEEGMPITSDGDSAWGVTDPEYWPTVCRTITRPANPPDDSR